MYVCAVLRSLPKAQKDREMVVFRSLFTLEGISMDFFWLYNVMLRQKIHTGWGVEFQVLQNKLGKAAMIIHSIPPESPVAGVAGGSESIFHQLSGLWSEKDTCEYKKVQRE
jgi:hypothetical protein